jgi:dolichyl-phosphate-mannose--protein O-mannosyl transferase
MLTGKLMWITLWIMWIVMRHELYLCIYRMAVYTAEAAISLKKSLYYGKSLGIMREGQRIG